MVYEKRQFQLVQSTVFHRLEVLFANLYLKLVYTKRMMVKTYPQHSNLNKERLPAFFNLGIDYAGLLYVTNIYNSDSNDMYKALLVIIIIITCVSSHRIYLDLVLNCTSEICIKVLSRFISSRGPRKISDMENILLVKVLRAL